MLKVENLIQVLKKNEITFFTGVPDSVLKKFSLGIQNFKKKKHLISTNEGSAVSIGIGYHLSTGKIPCVYLQNSGLSNAINPLISIASREVYSIPIILMIGWRGSPLTHDEPQHKAKGKITTKLLKLLKIDYCIIKKDSDLNKVSKLIKKSKKQKKVVAFLIEKGTLAINKKTIKKNDSKGILRHEFINYFLKTIPKKCKIISTTGFTSRELMEIRKKSKLMSGKDFYMVGGMGHSAAVAAGYTLHSNQKVFCLDGDGSILMHLGTLRTVGVIKKNNFKHIIFNNSSHESVGGQPTYADGINFNKLSTSLGYVKYFKMSTTKNFKNIIHKFLRCNGPAMLEVIIRNGTIKNLSRPKNLLKIKNNFMI